MRYPGQRAAALPIHITGGPIPTSVRFVRLSRTRSSTLSRVLSSPPESSPPTLEEKSGGGHGVLAAVILVIVLVVGSLVINLPSLVGGLIGSGSQTNTSQTNSGTLVSNSSSISSSTSVSSFLAGSPEIVNGRANVSYPFDYQQLEAYALGVINHDRSGFNLTAVVAGPTAIAQQHADSMLYFGYLSHYDTQGYKPYMRYTLLGGVGAVEENVAVESWGGPHYLDTQSVRSAIFSLEQSMLYNDSACCNNGHRLNILNPLHNRVSIGIAYNTTRAYLVEDFENYYLDLTYSFSHGSVTMTGKNLNPSVISMEMWVFYDPTPAPENVTQLNSGPRQYDPGTLTGGVLPPCNIFCPYLSSGITVHATTWDYTNSQVNISFSTSAFVQKYGAGVYTLYIITGDDTSKTTTTISIFVP